MTLDTKYDQFYDPAAPARKPADLRWNGWPRDREQAIVALPLSGDVILDIGCGGGHLLYQFRNRFKTLMGLEYSASRLQVAVDTLRGLHFVPIGGSAESMLDIATGSVDCIVTADVIEHIPDVYQACDEMFRVLKPGGTLAINTPNIAFAVKRLRLLMGRFPSTSQANEGLGSDVLFDGGHLHYFTFRSLGLLLERGGFRIERKMGYGPFGRLHDFHPALLSVGVQLVARKPA